MLQDSSNPATPKRPPHPKALAPAPQIPARQHPHTARPKLSAPQVPARKDHVDRRHRRLTPKSSTWK